MATTALRDPRPDPKEAARRAARGWEARLEGLAQAVTHWASGSGGFLFAAATVVLWLASGPFAGYSETWQLVINTGTTIVTFVMVFLIQRSQSKDSLAIQLKLDEVIMALAGASNQLVAVEELTESELQELNRRFHALKERASRLRDTGEALSVDGAPRRRKSKKGPTAPPERP